MTTYDSYKGVPLGKLAIDVKWWEYCNGGCSMSLSNRLWEIHEETRWVPVSERTPTKEDGNTVLVKSGEVADWYRVVWYGYANKHNGYTHWKRIQAPEGV